jgi:uncharacterized protein (TIGR03437 family)
LFHPQLRRFALGCGALIVSCAGFAFGQSGVSLAGFGYSLPTNSIAAAPGQIMVVSVAGLNLDLQTPLKGIPDNNGLPVQLNGVAVDFVQGPVTVQLGLIALQQSACSTDSPCSRSTSITLQIPYDLDPTSGDAASLRIKLNGSVAGAVALNPLTDSVHVLNTCDQTLIYLSVAYQVPAGICVPMIAHPDGGLVTGSAPAAPGETLVVWAYGLGAITHPIPAGCCSIPEQLPLVAQPFVLNFRYPDTNGDPKSRVIGGVAPTYAGMVGGGLYQIHFVVPPTPAALPFCGGFTRGNLSVQIAGPQSSDATSFCVQPQ